MLFVICHQDLPAYPLPADAHIMWMNAAPPPAVDGVQFIRGYDLFEKPDVLHAKLSGALGSAAVARHVAGLTERPLTVTIWQYRKFVTRQAFGGASPNYTGMRLLTPKQAADVDPAAELGGNGELIVRPLGMGTMMKQYQKHHNLVDLLRYVSVAIETGVLTQEAAMGFLEDTHIVPGGLELGTYETAVWLKESEGMFRVASTFIEQFDPHQADHPYQRRAVAFCQERLGSFMLLKRMRAAHPTALPAALLGTMHTVTDEAVYRGGS